MKMILPLTLVAAVAAISLHPNQASAYYSRRDVVRCDQNAGGNAVAGAIFGGIAGALIGGANGGNSAGLGAAIGAATGGSIGLGLSCREESAYIENVDRYLDDDRFDSPYDWGGGNVTVTRGFQRRDGAVCREYVSQVRTRRGWVNKTEVACRERGGWVHGYNPRDFRVMHDYRRPNHHHRFRGHR